MCKPLSYWIESDIPISPVNRTIQITRSKEIKQKFFAMNVGNSIVLPYPRDTVVGIVGDEVSIVCRQINDSQFRYWKR